MIEQSRKLRVPIDLSEADLSGANLSEANLSRANLSEANLSRANLFGADLFGADLSGAIGNMREIKSIQVEQYPIAYTKDRLQIGCENHAIEEWILFDNKRIAEMDGKRALEFWKKFKDTILNLVSISPA